MASSRITSRFLRHVMCGSPSSSPSYTSPLLVTLARYASTSCPPPSSDSPAIHHPADGYLWRSFFYVPGDQQSKITKIANICHTLKINSMIPDVIVLDCEDAVSVANKSLARSNIAATIKARAFDQYRHHLKRSVTVRINPPATGFAEDDLDAVLSASIETMKASDGDWPGPDLICLPKTESIDELRWVESKVMQIFEKTSTSQLPSLAFVGIVESPLSLCSMREICVGAKQHLKIPLVAMVFGSDDYCACLGVPHTETRHETLFARQYMVTMCKAYGLAAIDMVETDLRDMVSFDVNCHLGSQWGYTGKQLIHPKQIAPANEAFSPSPERIEWATSLVKTAEESTGGGDPLSAGAFTFRGHMIDRPTVRQAVAVLNLSKLIKGGYQ